MRQRNKAYRPVFFVTTIIGVGVMALMTGCGTAVVVDEPEKVERPPSARDALTSATVAALDAKYVAEYDWNGGGHSNAGTVTMWLATDGTWRVDVDAWGHGGEIDVSYAWTTGGFYQCANEICVKIADMTGEIPADLDPKVQRPFVEWLPTVADRHAPYIVTAGEDEGCYRLTSSTVVVDTPIPDGLWCISEDGVIESVETGGVGTLTRTGDVMAAPKSVALPGEIKTDTEVVERKKPKEEPKKDPETDPSATASPSASVSPGAETPPTEASQEQED